MLTANRQVIPQQNLRPYRGRFAPSPTGALHLGTAATALIAWLRARQQKGTLILRIEDIDHPRTLAGSQDSILADLRFLGLDWDEGPDIGGAYGPYLQSERTPFYSQALAHLEAQQLTFACSCTRKELAMIASAPHTDNAPKHYPGRCRFGPLNPERPLAIRYRLPNPLASFEDLIYGRSQVRHHPGDIILRRSDQLWAYQLAVAVDDAQMNITEVIRAADLLESTPCQIHIIQALGKSLPTYAHTPLILDAQGQRYSKRNHALSIDSCRKRGLSAQNIIGILAYALNLSPTRKPCTAHSLLKDFTLAKLPKHPVRIDI